MALIHCPECRTSVSSLATACPKCGCPISASMSPAAVAAAAVSSRDPRQVRDLLAVWSWLPASFYALLSVPQVISTHANQQHPRPAFWLAVLVIFAWRGALLVADQRHVARHLPDRPPSIWLAMFPPFAAFYFEQRRKVVGRGLHLMVIEVILMWGIPVVLFVIGALGAAHR